MRLIGLTALALSAATLALSCESAHAQANVAESNANYIYVDAVHGQDSNPGTQSAPLRTVQAGLNRADTSFNHKGLGSRVEVLPGTYRESAYIGPSAGRTSAPITLEAVTPGTVTIAASDLYTGWTDEGSGIVFDHAWTNHFGACTLPAGWPSYMPPIVFRSEIVVVNGRPLTQVLDSSLLSPGTFLVDETNSLLRVAPPSGTDLSTATVEVATRHNTLTVSGRANFVLRGIGLRHAANCFNQESGLIWNSSNVLVDKVNASFNNWGGFGVGNSHEITVQNYIGSFNGGIGILFSHSKNVAFANSETDSNNWRGAAGAFYDWGMGGAKFWQQHGGTVSSFTSLNNAAQGLWFDTDNRDITVSHATLTGNRVANLQVELNYGPITMTNSVLCYGDIGVNLNSSRSFSLTNSKLFDNSGTGTSSANSQAQIYIAGPDRGRSFTDWETGEYHNITTSNISLTSNIIEDWSSPNQNAIGTYVNSATWSQFVTTLVSDGNQWFDPYKPAAFMVPGYKHESFSDWQSSTGLDGHSGWVPVTLGALGCMPPMPLSAK